MAKVQTELVNSMDTMYQEFMQMANEDIFAGSAKTLKNMKDFTSRGIGQMAEQLKKGNYAVVREMKKAQQNMDAGFQESLTQLTRAQKKYQNAVASGDQARIEATRREVSQVEKRVNSVMKQTTKARDSMMRFADSLDAGQAKIEEVLKSREEKIKDLGKAGQVFQEHFAENLDTFAEKFTNGLKDMDSLGETLKSTFSSLGSTFERLQASQAKKADEGKGSMGFAKFLGSMGKFLKVMAVVGGSIMTLVSIFNFVEGQVLEANKAILEQNSVLDTVALGSEDLADNLERARKAFNDGRFANELGVAREELAKMAGEMNSLNLGFAYFGGNLNLQKESMKQLQGFSKAFGLSFGDVAGYMANFAENMGIGAEHGSVYTKMVRDFADLRDIALQTTYSTSNFFNKIKDLTNSMENMGLRTEEVANLFVRFSKILGPEGAQAMLNGLGMGFKGEGWLDMIKRQLLTKGEDIGKVLEVEAKRQSKSLLEAYGGDSQGSEGMKTLKRALGLDENTQIDVSALSSGLAGLDTKQVQALLSELSRGNKESQGLGQQLVGLIDVAKGAKGDRTARTRGMQSAGATAQTALNFAKLQNSLRGKDIRSMSDIQLEGLSNITGVQMEQIKMFQSTQDVLKGNLAFAKTQAENYRNMDAKEKAEADKRLADMGLAVVGGKLVLKDQQDQEVTGLVDMFMAQGAGRQEGAESERVKTTDDYLAEQVVATMSVADQINNVLGSLLQDISTGIYELVNWFFGKDNREEKKLAMNQLAVEQQRNLTEQQKLGAEITQQKQAVKDAELRMRETEDYKKADAETRKAMLETLPERIALQNKEKRKDELKDEATRLREAKANVNRSKLGSAPEILAEAKKEGREGLALKGKYKEAGGISSEAQQRIEAMQKDLEGTGFTTYDQLADHFDTLSADQAQKLAQELKDKHNIDVFQKGYRGTYETRSQERLQFNLQGGAKDRRTNNYINQGLKFNTFGGGRGFAFSRDGQVLSAQTGFLGSRKTKNVEIEERHMKVAKANMPRGTESQIKAYAQEFANKEAEKKAGSIEGIIGKPPTDGEKRSDAELDEKARAKEKVKQEGKLEAVRLKEQDKHRLRNLASSMGVTGDLSKLEDKEVIRRLKEKGPISESRAEQLQSLGVNTEGFTITTASGATPNVEKGGDVMLSGGRMMALDSQDSVIALKDRGPIDRVFGGRNVVINMTVNGAGDPEAVASKSISLMEQREKRKMGGNR